MQKTKLAAAISAALSIVAGQASAQQTSDQVEEVVVTGIRGSLQQALDIKRDSTGVVDAISAEDIGKFPDTNLAESLQRITGVSVNRVEGEGSEVTIRGFGGQFNLVTLNGRQLPAADNRYRFLWHQRQHRWRQFALLRLFEHRVRGCIGLAGVQNGQGFSSRPAASAA